MREYDNGSGSARDTTLVVFAVSGHPYGIPARQTREVLAWREPRPLPGAEAWIEGVLNLRGEIIPVCDLARALGLRAPRTDRGSSVLIVEMDEGSGCVGFTVDEVRAVATCSTEDLVEAPGGRHPAMNGVVRMDGELVVILDPTLVLRGAGSETVDLESERVDAPRRAEVETGSTETTPDMGAHEERNAA